jgi:DNA modification methylase
VAAANKNKLYYGDNLDVLHRYLRDASVDIVYLDPPFDSNQITTDSSKNKATPDPPPRSRLSLTRGDGVKALRTPTSPSSKEEAGRR